MVMSLAAYIKGSCPTLLLATEDPTKDIKEMVQRKKVSWHMTVRGTNKTPRPYAPRPKSPIKSVEALDTGFPLNLAINHKPKLSRQSRAGNLAKD